MFEHKNLLHIILMKLIIVSIKNFGIGRKRISPFDMIAKSMIYYFEKKNIITTMIHARYYNKYNIDPNDVVLIFSPALWMFRKSISLPKKVIVYNTEPINVKNWYNKIFKKIMRKASIIFDYSKYNLLKYENKQKYYLPPVYSPYLEHLFNENYDDTITTKDIDILFYGTITGKRRRHIKKNLSKISNIKIKFIEIIPTMKEQTKLIQRSKIVLDYFYYDKDKCIDYPRCSYLIANKVFVIHETPRKEEYDEEFSYYIVTCPYHKIVKTCLKYLNKTEDERNIIVENAYQWFKESNNLDKYIPYDDIITLLEK